MILHTGTSWGYGALLTIIPDLDIAIHTSISGPDSGYRARRVLHMYVADLISGFEPFLNTSVACTYPDMKPSSRAVNYQDATGVVQAYNNSVYEGQYGNHAYSNLSVITNESSGRLQIQYGAIGLWDLYPTSTANVFKGQGRDVIWSSRLSGIIFSAYDNETQTMGRVTVTTFETKDPPVFKRDLS